MAPHILKQRRQELELTQVAVAKSIGVSQPTYQNYEAGTLVIPEAKLKRLAKVLRLTKEEILGKPKVVKETPTGPEKETPTGRELIDAYWGEAVIHFRHGTALVLSISYEEYKRLFAALQDDTKFFNIVTLSNRIVAVRRAAVTDVYLADEASDTYGPEQGTYEIASTGLWSRDPRYWQIVDDLVSDAKYREDIEEEYSKDTVTEIARGIGLDMPDDIDWLIREGQVDASERESALLEAAETLERVRHLACDVTWRLSMGKVRHEPAWACDLTGFWWIEDGDLELQGPMIIVDLQDNAQTAFINPDELDYLSIPEHRYRAAIEEEMAKMRPLSGQPVGEDEPTIPTKRARKKGAAT